MKTRWLPLLLLLVCAVSLGRAGAGEPYLQFLEGLRQRRYYDYALLYLDQLAADSSVPSEVRDVLPYERAVTLLQSAQTLRSPQAQAQQLDEALKLFDQFVRAHPNHPKVAEANSQRARVLLDKGRVRVWQIQSTSNESDRKSLRQEARTLFKQAREILRDAQERYDAALKKFPTYIDERTQAELYEQRKKVEAALISAKLRLALCTYYEAQTYDPGSQPFRRLLAEACDQLGKIHEPHRTQVGGLYARLWQAKCFEEQGDVRKALGIYKDLLNHPGRSPQMQRLKDQAFHFRLICLNHEKRKDYALVVQQAEEWLKARRGAAGRTPEALAVRWQLALAQEKLAQQRGRRPAERQRLLQAAIDQLRLISRYPGEFQDRAKSKLRALLAEVGGAMAITEPQDFESAFGAAAQLAKEIQKKNDAVRAAREQGKSSQEVAKLEEDRRRHLEQTKRLLKRALQLAKPRTPLADLNQARYLLGYVHYLLRESYEAAILGEFVATHYQQGEAAAVSQDCAYLALAAYLQAYNDSPDRWKSVDVRFMERMAELLESRWPESDRADDARMQMGQVYLQQNEPGRAAEWFSRVRTKSSRYAAAQIAAGQAYWTQFLRAIALPEDRRPPADQLGQWQQAAQKHLERGIARMEKEASAQKTASSDLVSAKVSLAQIVLNQGDYKGCLEVLSRSPHSVLEVIAAGDEPEAAQGEGIKSAEFASLVYQLLLRANIGLQRLEAAREIMKRLEQLATQTGGSDTVSAIYVELGRQLQDELKRLQTLGDQKRLAEVRQSFENFLNDMFQRKGQTFGTLIWVAETYFGLAEGTQDAPQKAQQFFQRAAETYQNILQRAQQDSNFMPQKAEFAVKLRLLKCLRRKGDFQKALELAAELLAENPNSLEAQTEAAYTLQDWGLSQPGQFTEKLRDAILGCPLGEKKAAFWGWGQIALNLQRLLASKKVTEREKVESKLYEARYNSALCRYQYALAQRTKEKRVEQLQRTKAEILAFASIVDRFSTDWYDQFDQLYRKVQTDLGEKPAALEKPERRLAAPTKPQRKLVASRSKAPAPAPRARTQPEPRRFGWGFLALTTLLLVATVVGIFMMVKSQLRPRPVPYAVSSAVRLPSAPAKRTSSRGTKTAGSRSSSASASRSASGRSQVRRTATKRKPLPKEGDEGGSAGTANQGTSGKTTRKPKPSRSSDVPPKGDAAGPGTTTRRPSRGPAPRKKPPPPPPTPDGD